MLSNSSRDNSPPFLLRIPIFFLPYLLLPEVYYVDRWYIGGSFPIIYWKYPPCRPPTCLLWPFLFALTFTFSSFSLSVLFPQLALFVSNFRFHRHGQSSHVGSTSEKIHKKHLSCFLWRTTQIRIRRRKRRFDSIHYPLLLLVPAQRPSPILDTVPYDYDLVFLCPP